MGLFSGRTTPALPAVAAMLLVCGCSTLPLAGPDTVPPLRTYEAVVKGEGPRVLEVYDPLEGFNRGAYRFNYYFDEYLYLPVVRAYKVVVPDYAKERISSALDNLNEFGNLTNNLLQLRLKSVGITLGRVFLNSTVGIVGLWDPATACGLTRQTEDFGLTLGHYGVGNGAYVVLPVGGPSNARDTTGLAADMAAFSLVGPIAWVNDPAVSAAYSVMYAVDRRYRIPFHYGQTGSPFEYELVRMLYTIKREIDVEQSDPAH
jgi:phospholipid-binding lipoprotein MlaA